MRALLAILLLAAFACPAKETELRASAPKESPVWCWMPGNRGLKMKLEVQLDGTEIFTTRFTIAHTYRNTIADASYKKMVRFSFKPGRRIAWEGYQDQTVISPAGRSVAGNIWMAGADDNAIILGVSFENSDEILMNTLHLALANKEVRTEIAKGLVVITSPVPDKIKP